MKKIFSLALALSLGVVAPQTVAAKSSSKIEVTEIKHHDGYDEVMAFSLKMVHIPRVNRVIKH